MRAGSLRSLAHIAAMSKEGKNPFLFLAMKFSSNYKSKYFAEADEIKCPYNQLGLILKKLSENQRLVITIPAKYDLDKLISQLKLIPSSIDYTVEGNLSLVKTLLLMGYKAFLKYPIADWETFTELEKIGVSDIYIDGSLGFQTRILSFKNPNTKIRVSPTISSNSAISEMSPESFYILPVNLSQYEDFIDIIDFKESNLDREEALFRIYKNNDFSNTIDLLIKGLPPINHLMFDKDFAEGRLNCKQRCKIPGFSCHTCGNYYHMVQQYDNTERH